MHYMVIITAFSGVCVSQASKEDRSGDPELGKYRVIS